MTNNLKECFRDGWLLVEGIMIGLNACGHSRAFWVWIVLLLIRILFGVVY